MGVEHWIARLEQVPYLGAVVRAVVKGRDDHSKDMAASIAYFSFFSLFPLLLGVAAIASSFFVTEEARTSLDRLLADALPRSASFVRRNVEALYELRGAAGVVSVVGLFWSARRMFAAVSRGMNGALGLTRSHSVVLSPLRHLGTTIVVCLLLFLLVAVSMFLGVVAQFELELPEGLLGDVFQLARGYLVSYSFVVVMCMVLYRILPYRAPSWREVLPGALLAGLLYEIGKVAFVFYVDNIAGLQAVYGSLSSVIVLMLWLYFSASVLLLGAELIAVNRQRKADA